MPLPDDQSRTVVPSSTIDLSVLIPCYNGEEFIRAQLDALARQRCPQSWEVIVADNRSTDQSAAIVKEYEGKIPNLRIVDAWERQGQPYAINAAAAVARGTSLILIDADDEVEEGYLAAMGKALEVHDLVAARIDIARFNTPEQQKARPHAQQFGVQEYTYPPYLPHAGGGTLGVKRELFELVGGMDESLPLLHDTDFCWKLQQKGTEIQFVSDAVLHYRYRGTLAAMFRQSMSYGEYNVILYKRYRVQGMPNLTLRKGIREWINLFLQTPDFFDKEARVKMIRKWGWRLGRLKGSLAHCVLAL